MPRLWFYPHMRSSLRTPRPHLVSTSVLAIATVILSSFAPLPCNAGNERTVELIPSAESGWPQFRGLRRDGISDETGLSQSWPESGPKIAWTIGNLGRGFSSPTISNGRIFITGDVGEELRIFAFDMGGKPLWQQPNGLAWKDPYPGARSTPAYSAGRIYHQNAHGRVACFKAETGKELWSVELLEQFKGKNITWGLSECLLVDDRAVYATAGGAEALCVALDKTSGEVLWKSEPLVDSEGERSVESPSYVSPILIRFAGRRLLVGCSLRHLYCVDADSGRIEWTRRMPTMYSVLSMMPAVVGDGIFMTAPHGKGGYLFRLLPPAAPDAKVGFEQLWSTRLDTLQGCVVNVDGRLLGAFYPGRKGWAAVDVKNGEVLYTAPDFVKGAGLYADNRLYALCEDGWMLLLKPTSTQFEVKGRFRLAEASGRDAWAHPVIHDKRLYLRYHDTLSCYEIGAGE